MNNNKLNKILVVIIAVLLFVILAGTIVGLVTKKNNSPEILISQGKAENLNPPVDTTEISYFELGTMRIIPELESTDDKENLGTVMVITPWLAYPAGDTVFYEEISRKQGVIKSLFTSYFSMKTKSEILSVSEENIISFIMEEINSKLSLGQISNIFFTDYIFLE